MVFLELVVAFLVEAESRSFASAAVVVTLARSGIGWTGFRCAEQRIDAHATHFTVTAEKGGGWVLVDFFKNTGLQHFLVEVATVKLHTEDGLVKPLQFGHGEAVTQQIEANRLKMNVFLELLHGFAEHVVVIESETRHFVERKPLGLGRIVAALQVGFLG